MHLQWSNAAGQMIRIALHFLLRARCAACAAVVVNSLLTAMGVQVGYSDITSAAMPEMCGALMLVPKKHSLQQQQQQQQRKRVIMLLYSVPVRRRSQVN
jgi:hypothetical protein